MSLMEDRLNNTTSKSQPYSNLFILILPTAGLITIQILSNQGCQRHAASLLEPRLVAVRVHDGDRAKLRECPTPCPAQLLCSADTEKVSSTGRQDPKIHSISVLPPQVNRGVFPSAICLYL